MDEHKKINALIGLALLGSGITGLISLMVALLYSYNRIL